MATHIVWKEIINSAIKAINADLKEQIEKTRQAKEKIIMIINNKQWLNFAPKKCESTIRFPFFLCKWFSFQPGHGYKVFVKKKMEN